MTLRVAAAQYPIEALSSFAVWRQKQARLVAEASAAGAQLLVLPEYAPLELTSVLSDPDNVTLQTQLRAVQGLWPQVIEAYAELAVEHGVWLLGGTLTERVDASETFQNRARLFGPQRQLGLQSKLQMTRFEREEWGISAGSSSSLLETPLGRLGIMICYDAEFPLIARRLIDAGADVLLVPSCTDTLAGYHRVAISCRARALENQCYVVHACTVGSAPWSLALDENRGAAGVYSPMDYGFPASGLLAPGTLDAPGWVYADLELAQLAHVRREGQVWNHRDWDLPNHLAAPVRVERLA